MFAVNLINDEYTEIHSPVSDVKLTAARLLRSINEVEDFSFSFLPNNPANGLLQPMVTRLVVTRLFDNKELFEGRVTSRDSSIDANNRSEQTYSAEGIIGVLRDSHQPAIEFEGSPSGFIELLFGEHNGQVEDWKKFQLGVCEVDTYRFYPDENTITDVVLDNGDSATIKPTTKYIYSSATSTTALNISNLVLGVTHTVVGDLTNGRYLLKHPNPAWGNSGWVAAEDIVETYIASGGSVGNGSGGSVRHVRVKESATVYYVDSYTTVGVPIKEQIRSDVNLTIGNKNNGRYALYSSGSPVAWINEYDLIFGSSSVEPYQSAKPNFIEEKRVIKVESQGGQTFELLMQHVIDEIGGEIEVVKEDGVYTLNIREQIGVDSDLMVAWNFNIQDFQEAMDGRDIYTQMRPYGNRAEGDETEGRIELDELVVHEALVSAYGKRTASEVFDDVKNTTDLKQRAFDSLDNQLNGYYTTSMTVLELGLLESELELLELGNRYVTEVGSTMMRGVRRLIVQDLNLLALQKSDVTFGVKYKDFMDPI